MKLNQLKLYCYAEKDKEGDWFAICLDLNVTATASSYHEVKNKLESMIKIYIEEALTSDKNYIEDLIPRRAPIYFYLRYYFYRVANFFNHHKTSHKETHKIYNMALPVHV